MQVGRLAARAVIGGLFVGHGTQKLFGWFDGPGLKGVSGMMESLELRPPKRHAMAAGISETVVLIAALTALAEHGPGRPSVDGDRLHGRFWALASLGAGIAGSYLATSPPVNEQPEREPTGRFTREKEHAPASV